MAEKNTHELLILTNAALDNLAENITTLGAQKASKKDPRFSDRRDPNLHTHKLEEVAGLEEALKDLKEQFQNLPQFYTVDESNKLLDEIRNLTVEQEEELKDSITKVYNNLEKSDSALSQDIEKAIRGLEAKIEEVRDYRPTQIIERVEVQKELANNTTIVQQVIDVIAIEKLKGDTARLFKRIEELANGNIDTRKLEDDILARIQKKVEFGKQTLYITRNGIQYLEQLSDVEITSPIDGDVLTYDDATGKWINSPSAPGGITSINADATAAQLLITGTGGTDFAIVDNGTGTHAFNLPIASVTNTGKLSNTDWTTFNNKLSAILTTKGDIYTYSTVDARLPVGSNTQILMADSSTATGQKWNTHALTGDVTGVLTSTGNLPAVLVKASSIFSYTGVISPASISGTQNDYNPTGLSTASTIRFTLSSDTSIGGIAGGSSGRILKLINTSAFNIFLNGENLGSTAANRFALTIAGATGVVIPGGSQMEIIYDGTTSRWRTTTAVKYVSASDSTLTVTGVEDIDIGINLENTNIWNAGSGSQTFTDFNVFNPTTYIDSFQSIYKLGAWGGGGRGNYIWIDDGGNTFILQATQNPITIGDGQGEVNGTQIYVDDANYFIDMFSGGVYGLHLDFDDRIFVLGDLLGAVNGNVVEVDDGSDITSLRNSAYSGLSLDYATRTYQFAEGNLLLTGADKNAYLGGMLHLVTGGASAGTAPLVFNMAGSSVLTTPVTGTMETNADNVFLTKKTAIREAIPGVLFTQTADKTVANTTTETSIVGTGVGTLTLPANFFVAGKTIRISMSGVYSTVAVTGDTVTVKIKYGSTVLASKATTALVTGGTNLAWSADLLITCRTTGSSGTVQVSGGVTYQIAAAAAVYDEINNGVSTSTLNTTNSGLFDVTVTHSAANASNTVKSLVTAVEVLN